MLCISERSGRSSRFCDGVSRRSFLQVGALALGGLNLQQILAAETTARPHKAVIMAYLAGGPPHQDMWDIKTEAPSEIRGPLQPIDTNVPGIQICELFPKIAQMMDKCAIIRTINGGRNEHSSHHCFSGFSQLASQQRNQPCLGSFLTKIRGPVDESVPAFTSLSTEGRHSPWGNPGEPGFLGRAYAPYQPDKEGLANMLLNAEVGVDRFENRRDLFRELDTFRRSADEAVSGLDQTQQKALGVLTSSRLLEALDVTKESAATRERYGIGGKEPVYDENCKNVSDGPCREPLHFLMARRLVEAGVRCVTLNFSRWDWHGNNFGRARQDMPMLDRALSALIQDLHDRGLSDDVSVVVWGEFGRTPKINKTAGRDHWPSVGGALLAGGGMKTGQVIGSTNRLGERPQTRPVDFQEVFATLYHNLGIDVDQVTVTDRSGRPQYLLDKRTPISELI